MAASSLIQTDEEEEITLFVPELTIEITQSCLVHITITNIKQYWKHNSFDLPIRSCLRLFFGFNKSNNQTLSQTKRIQVGRIPRDAQFYLKAPLFLCGYNLSLCLSAINRKTNQWMDTSSIHTIKIPSIWSLNEYKIGDKVVFKAQQEVIVRDATITQILSDNKYKLKYSSSNSKETEIECDVSRIYSEAPNIRCTIDLTSDLDVIKHLFVQRNDEESIDIYSAIKDGLSQSSILIRECVSMYGFDFLIHLQPISHFISCTVISYLFEPLFAYSVHCLFDVNHKKKLRFVNEMQYLYRVAYEMGGMSMDDMDNLNCSCDLCRTEVSKWSFMFVDESCVCVEEAHHYCTNCILCTILLNKELKNVLYFVLEDELNVDCIDEIVNCLIGNVVYTDLQCRKKVAVKTNKRVILDHDEESELMPNIKKRKLNL